MGWGYCRCISRRQGSLLYQVCNLYFVINVARAHLALSFSSTIFASLSVCGTAFPTDIFTRPEPQALLP